MKRTILFALGVAGFVFPMLSWGAGQTSTNFAIPRDTINNGTADMSSTNYRLASSVGDAVATGTITSVGYQLGNGIRAQVSVSPAVLNLLSVVSRKFHGTTPFNLTIDKSQPITGNITVEPRAIGSGHLLVFHFDNTVNTVGAVTALDAALNGAATVAFSPSGADVLVTLTNVADSKRLTVTLTGVNGSPTAVVASMGFLVGDVNSKGNVNAVDIAAVKANVGKTVSSNAIALFDLNANGSITQSDVSMVKANAAKVLP